MNKTERKRDNRTIVRIAIIACIMALTGACVALAGCSASSPSSTSASDSASTATADEHAYTDTVAKGATSAHLLLKADAPLAADINADCVTLDGAFSGFEVKEIERVDDAALSVVVALPDGAKPKDDVYAFVDLGEAAFEQGEQGQEASSSSPASSSAGSSQAAEATDAEGHFQTIALSVEDPSATIVPLEGSYDAEKNAFVLPISLGYAEFARAPKAADFSLADGAFAINGVDYDDSSLSTATLHIALPEGASPREAFDALDATLTASGITVAADATNCGKVTIGSNEMRKAERDGFQTTALSCVAAQPSASVESTYAIESKTQDEDGITDYDVHLQTKIDTETGSCALPEEGIGEAVEVDHLVGGDEGQVLGEDVIRIDGSQLYLNVYLPSKVIAATSTAEGDEALAEAQNDVAQLARAHKLVLSEGVLVNAWGVPEPKTEVALLLPNDLNATEGDAASNDAAIALIEKAYAAETDEGEGADDNSQSASSAGDSSGSASAQSDSSDDDPDNSAGSGNSDDPDASGGSDDGDDSDDDSKSAASDGSDSSASSDAAADADPEQMRADYATTDATDIEEDSPDDGSEAADSTFGQVDYSAYDLANDDEDMKKAKEAFEIMEKIFETAGAFAEFAAEDNPAGLIEGIGGVFGFISQAVGLGEGDLVNLQDVMDKLNKMDDEITTIDSKIDQLADELKKVEKELGYHQDLNALRAAVTQTEVYGPLLKNYVWGGEAPKWDYDDSKGFDGMSAEQIAGIETFLDHVEGKQSTYGYNAAADTVKLGNLIVGDPVLGAQSVIQEYNECVNTKFNWEPETYLYRQLFMSRLMYAYTCGYSTAITQLQYTAWKSDNPKKYTEALQDLTDNYKKVHEAVQGKVDYKQDGDKVKSTVTKESPFVAATHDDGSGKLRNLVTGRLFGGDSEQLIYLGGLTKFCNHASDPEDLDEWTFNGSISSGNFESMAERLANTKYKSLWEEMVAMTGSDRGFITSNWSAKLNMSATWYHKGFTTEDIHASLDADSSKDPKTYYGRILVKDTSKKCINNQASHRHTYNWVADYFDLNDNAVHKGAEIYIADQKYNAGDIHWSMWINLHNFYTMKAVG